jgi:N-carbamoylputrescine amidase
MRVTVCELPHRTDALADAWAALCEHTVANGSQLVLLPELAMVEPVWECGHFDAARWVLVETLNDMGLRRLRELHADYVVGTRPVRLDGRRLNQGFLWSPAAGVQPLRSKYFLPEEPGSWEATWFERGDPVFPAFRAGAASFGINICTELWALETYAAYAALGVDLLLSPRATALDTTAKWLAVGVVAAVRSGAFSLSSNRVDTTGAGGGSGWIIDPAGKVLSVTSAAEPFATRDIDLAKAAEAKDSYPRYVFSGSLPDRMLASGR